MLSYLFDVIFDSIDAQRWLAFRDFSESVLSDVINHSLHSGELPEEGVGSVEGSFELAEECVGCVDGVGLELVGEIYPLEHELESLCMLPLVLIDDFVDIC